MTLLLLEEVTSHHTCALLQILRSRNATVAMPVTAFGRFY